MLKKEQEVKNKFNAFSEIMYTYKMKECKFHPNINKYKNDEEIQKNKKRLNSCK